MKAIENDILYTEIKIKVDRHTFCMNIPKTSVTKSFIFFATRCHFLFILHFTFQPIKSSSYLQMAIV